ncbi:hypothetical protein EDB86DRAFT_3245104 [Lactarius hatsudake]|nr:hypothetical protein EDB86DRAFT_3245104 [Lactarius hatsudake]
MAVEVYGGGQPDSLGLPDYVRSGLYPNNGRLIQVKFTRCTSAPPYPHIPSMYASTTLPYPTILSLRSPSAFRAIATSTTLPPMSTPQASVVVLTPNMANNGHDTTIDLRDSAVPESINWGLGSLGRGDMNKTLSNLYSFVALVTGYTNLDVSLADIPVMNIIGTIPGPLDVQYYVSITAPNTSAGGAGGAPVLVASGLDTSFTTTSAPTSSCKARLGAAIALRRLGRHRATVLVLGGLLAGVAAILA